MMYMTDFFSGNWIFYGIISALIVPFAIYIAVRFTKRLPVFRNRGIVREDSQTAQIDAPLLQSRILAAAQKNNGFLTVSDVVLSTGLSIKQAEESLNSMVDSYRVKMEVSDSGIVVYEFVELVN